MTYDASEQFWNPLAADHTDGGVIPEGPQLERLKELTYAEGTKVLKDFRLIGWQFMRTVLQELDKADDSAFRELGYEAWSEENQKSPRNDPFIMKAVMAASRR